MTSTLQQSGATDFAARLESLAAGGSATLAATRRAALARFEQLGWPTRRNEAWKYTSLAPVARTRYGWPASPTSEVAAPRLPGAAGAGERWVFVDGRHDPEHSAPAPSGQPTVGRLMADVLAERAETLELAPDESHAIVALNTALCEDGLVVRVPARRALELPLEVVFAARTPGAAAFPRLHVHLEREARLTLFERHVGGERDGEAGRLVAPLVQVTLEDGASLEHTLLVEHGPGTACVGIRRARLGRDARLQSHVFALGGVLTRDELELAFEGPGAEVELGGLALAGPGDHVDLRTFVDHAVPHCASRQVYHAVVGGDGESVFNGAVLVRPGAQGTEAHQTNRNLLLSHSGRADTKPELEIFADDVQCSHGATIGQLDADALFYLRSRALGLDQARALLTRAFASAVVERVRPAELASLLEAALEHRLSAALSTLPTES